MVFESSDALARNTASSIVELAKECVAESGHFNIALSGGSTPKSVYALLSDPKVYDGMPWDKTFLFWGDERFVRPDHPDSNYRMVYEALLKKGPVPLENILPIQTNEPDPAACAAKYEAVLKEKLSRKEDDFPVFDLILLGIGADGHTASLFPGTPAPLEMTRAVTWCDPAAANPAVKPPVPRITITAPVIWRAANVFVLAEGASKKEILSKIFASGPIDSAPVARLLWRCEGQVRFFIDNAALPKTVKAK
jgi:6-phosphogluconolactonase